MSKTRSKIKLCIVAFLTIIGLLLTFTSFVIPNTNTTFNGFFNAINFGYDINGGRLAIYEVDSTGLTDDEVIQKLNQTVSHYNKYFSNDGFVFSRHGNTLRVEVSKFDDSDMSNLFALTGSTNDIFDFFGASQGISINTSSSDSNAEGSITSEYVVSCTLGGSLVGQDGDVYPVTINLTSEGQKLLKEMTENLLSSSSTSSSTSNLYLYLNGQNYNSSGFEISSPISTLTLYATSSTGAKALACQVNALAKSINLNQVFEGSITSGLNTSAGVLFGNAKTMLSIIMGILFVATFVFLLVRYRMLGLLACMSILVFICVYTFLLQSIPLVLLDVNGLIGVLMVYALLVCGMIGIFEKIRAEYRSGKKIPNSVMTGFRKNLLTILEKYVFLLILSAVLFILGGASVKSFAICLFVGLFVNYFVLFVVLRGTSYSYTVVNSIKKSLYNLKREVVTSAK